MGSTVTLKILPPPPVGYNKLMGFAFWVVVAFPVLECIRHQSVEDDWKRNLHYVDCHWKLKSERFHRSSLGRNSYVESDHVFLGSYLFDGVDLCMGQITCFLGSYFSFCIHRCEVKKCGIDFVYAQGPSTGQKN